MPAGWAAGDPAQPPLDLLRPFPAEQMTAWKVDKAVGNVRNDTAQLLEQTGAAEVNYDLLWDDQA